MISYIRYIVGRTKKPKAPRILKSGRVSSSRDQDTTFDLYMKACEETGTVPDDKLGSHLNNRDITAWIYSVDFPVMYSEAENMAREIASIATRRMRRESEVPPRNPWSCHAPFRCDWLELCHSDPSGNIDEWWGIGKSDYSGVKDYKIKMDNGIWKELDRSKPGAVVSPSEVRCYLDCPRKWHFEYVKKARRYDLPFKRYSARFKGNMTHLAAELTARHFKENSDIPSIKQVAIPYFLEIEEMTKDMEFEISRDELHEEADTCLRVGYKMAQNALADANRILHIEQRMAVVIPGTKTWLTCQPDLVTETNDGICITDYKTTSQSRLDQVAEGYRYNPAMYLYALALESGRPMMEV